jgi:hypothetical protein
MILPIGSTPFDYNTFFCSYTVIHFITKYTLMIDMDPLDLGSM